MIGELIRKAFEKEHSLRKDYPENSQSRTLPSIPFPSGIPTLKQGHYHEASPMLKERFNTFGRWRKATHGHWLGIDDMEVLWTDPVEQFLKDIKSMREAGESDWPNEASALFKQERLSLFACSDFGNEKIYLLWLDFEDEPEFWVYDSNGETRYKNLGAYLDSYLNDDLSAVGKTWRA